MHQLAADQEANFPLGAKILRRDFYVDDLLTGGDSVKEVINIRQQIADLLSKGQFIIRKWCSNDSEVLKNVPTDQCEKFDQFHDGSDITKTLGLVWDPKRDIFIFAIAQPKQNTKSTKRSILSSIARLYDPLGLIGPVITKAKVLMQQLWKLDLSWDASLLQQLETAWLNYTSSLSLIPRLTFDRYVSTPSSKLQLHAFCDASLTAYGACLYLRSELDDTVKIRLLCSKSRVAPLKTLTVPKLELSAALLLAELLDVVIQTLPFDCSVHCWSDSMVVLSWLKSEPSNFNVFVSNRVSKIKQLTEGMHWHHVPTSENPADTLSRGATPRELLESSLWFEGPGFLHGSHLVWPECQLPIDPLPELRKRCILTVSNTVDLLQELKFLHSFGKLQRVFGYIYKFGVRGDHRRGPLTTMDIKLGTNLLIRLVQKLQFSVEYKLLKNKTQLSKSSELASLAPFLDENGVLRVGGRLKNSLLDFDLRHPIILPKNHKLTTSIIDFYHHKLLYAGPQALLASLRNRYWPIGGRKYISHVISKCIRCFHVRPRILQQIMGELPKERVQSNRIFHITGIDFCGPFFYRSEVRNRAPIKCYVCLFVCLSTKAVHLELAKDLSTDTFLAALKRFISIRGKPQAIWSDNATNFVGARNELADLHRLFSEEAHMDAVKQQCLDDGIMWKFIPPRSPHFGGLWESAVKAAKHHLRRVVALSVLNFEELRTLVYQVSAILNSRPLCQLSDNPDDLDVITPAHFLVGVPFHSIVEPDVTALKISVLSLWQRVCYMHQLFWKKWRSDYLTTLQQRSKWKNPSSNLKIGSLVLLKDDNLPPLKWPLGQVVETISGEDGVVRVAILKTTAGMTRRAITKLCALPIDVDDDVESVNLPTGGVCSQQQ